MIHKKARSVGNFLTQEEFDHLPDFFKGYAYSHHITTLIIPSDEYLQGFNWGETEKLVGM